MIANIRLQNFRSYKDESFDFEPSVNIIVGPNGSGKTNLLEAIQVIATGSSYRTEDAGLIEFEAEWARVDISTDKGNRVLKIETIDNRTKKSYLVEDKPYKTLKQEHVLPTVLFEPSHLQLLSGQPEKRRSYLDSLLGASLEGYSMVRKHYTRVLAQRNSLLKSAGRVSKEQFFVWNLRLSELGGVIARARFEMINNISKELPNYYSEIAGSSETKVSISYLSKLPSDNYETALLKKLEESYERDLSRGFTSTGPHRDDFEILFDDRPANEVASRGETRTALLALKIHESRDLEKTFNKKPLLLLDDVFSELDAKRRHALAAFLKSHQTFITTTDADLVLHNQLQDSHIILLSKTP